jgi:N-acyl-D-aspartate/D-glutamate deacylase
MKPHLRIAAALFGALFSNVALPADYDLVIENGRVIDPETRLDAVRYVGIRDGRIAAITAYALPAAKTLDAAGLVVAPGFIDLHAHGQNTVSQTYQVRDGVTTALELESGTYELARLLVERDGSSLINYGYSASHGEARMIAKQGDLKRAFHEPSSAAELDQILALVEESLDNGGLGIGVPLDYISRGVSEAELQALFLLSARRQVPLFVHIRMPNDMEDPSGYAELIDMARETGGIVHMVHLVSTGGKRVPVFLRMMADAQAEGLDVTTEAYPYTAGSTGINSGIFDHDWQRKFGVSYDAIEWPPTGVRFTGKEMWDEYRAKYPEGTIIIHAMTEEQVEQAYSHPGVIVASDGMPIESLDERAHPRGMGTYARILGRYVREREVMTLMDAISRMSLLPAKRLEEFAPVFERKGRVQVGADADLTIFNPDTVIDRATFAEPNQFSKGIVHVVVNGTVVVQDEKLVKKTFPGRPLNTHTR